ncbi:MAG: EamA family transporter [Bacteroidales bacterium]|nr:EamA family transporter [Bacteroidales bacterium]
MGRKASTYLVLIAAFFIYALSSVATKAASGYPALSAGWLLFIAGAVLILGIYAIVWQQIIKRMPVSDAYMFRGTVIIFILLISYLVFGEPVTARNIIGAAVIICGIAINAKS